MNEIPGEEPAKSHPPSPSLPTTKCNAGYQEAIDQCCIYARRGLLKDRVEKRPTSISDVSRSVLMRLL